MNNRLPSVLCFFTLFLLSGCITPPIGTTQVQEIQTLRGATVKVTRISLPTSPNYGNVQIAAGYVWATLPSPLGLHKTIKVDTKSYEVTELPRPFSAGAADLLVDDHSIWFSDGMTKISGQGDLYRVDITSNKLTATIKGAGSPFAISDNSVWAYNFRRRVITGIDTGNNRAHKELATQGGEFGESFAFGDGSIWQFTQKDEASTAQEPSKEFFFSSVRRIDPQTNRTVAEIPLGPFRLSDRLGYVAGDIWVLGERDESGEAFAVRIDSETNRIIATIPLVRSVSQCGVRSFSKTPVLWKGAILISTFCTNVGRMPGILLKIDLQTNEIVDEIGLSTVTGHMGGQPALTAEEDALWGFDGYSAIRFDF